MAENRAGVKQQEKGRKKRRLAAAGATLAAALAVVMGTGTNAYAASMIFPLALSTPDWYCGHSEQSATVRLVFQCDGNLVLYRLSDGKPVWDTATEGKGATRLDFSSAGYVELYAGSREICTLGRTDINWLNGTTYSAAYGGYADIQDDGNFVIYSSSGSPVWATGTYNNRISSNDGCHV